MSTEQKKERFLSALSDARGIITVACKAAGISRTTYYSWRDTDETFRAEVEEIEESQIDYVESKLLEKIEGGDTTATIFYLKAKGKKRGWNESYDMVEGRDSPAKIRAATEDELRKITENESYIDNFMKRNKIRVADWLHSLMNEEITDYSDKCRVVEGITEEKVERVIGILRECLKGTAEHNERMRRFDNLTMQTAGGRIPAGMRHQ